MIAFHLVPGLLTSQLRSLQPSRILPVSQTAIGSFSFPRWLHPSRWPRDSLRPLAGGIPRPLPPPHRPTTPISPASSLSQWDPRGDVDGGHSRCPSLGYDIGSARQKALCALEKNVWAENLGTVVPPGQHFLPLCHPPLLTSPAHSSLTASGLCTHSAAPGPW